ncbi:MAG TPA: hydroxymethylbilane synthase [Solirubrobacteraceae bacterium]|nr:hydroxymethylbilane synthase [Solirubrobacteraceae bacterium]
MSGPLRLGTRGSPLALRQAELVATAIGEAVEVVVLRTGGDLGSGGDKRRWVDSIEAALLEGSIDLAVHSAKDLPAELAVGLEIAAAPKREDPRDALCGPWRSLGELPQGARVGTSSPRRRAQLLAMRDDLAVVELHGNLDTRLGRLENGDYDAVVLAVAGLRRLGRDDGWSASDDFVPAAGQGTLAVEARVGDERVAAAIAGLRDRPSERALAAERTTVARLGAGCDSALGVLASTKADDGIFMRGFVASADGGEWIRDEVQAGDAVEAGELLAQRLLSCGAAALLR